MSILMHPAALIDLGQVGERGLPLSIDPKFVRELQVCREWGFKLQTTTDHVRLDFDQDQLVPGWIQNETPPIAWERLEVKGFLRLTSTNSEALELARRGLPSGTLVFAEEQTMGRGRNNRTWISPAGAGLYCTLILRPKQPPKNWPLLTLAAAIALVDTLKDFSDCEVLPAPLDIDIKWPNDVLLTGKKCAGILLESLLNEAGNPAAVVGFGINVRKESVPKHLASEAISLEEMTHTRVPRRLILVRFLYFFQICYLAFEQGKHPELLERWKSYSSMWNGVPIWIGEGEMRRPAITCGLNEIGALLVRTRNGTVQTLYAESIRIPGNLKAKYT
jgi:BirA family biotin operon repressor/biotin-[acetyl-CoA-carboxylase] ligase